MPIAARQPRDRSGGRPGGFVDSVTGDSGAGESAGAAGEDEGPDALASDSVERSHVVEGEAVAVGGRDRHATVTGKEAGANRCLKNKIARLGCDAHVGGWAAAHESRRRGDQAKEDIVPGG